MMGGLGRFELVFEKWNEFSILQEDCRFDFQHLRQGLWQDGIRHGVRVVTRA